jgi:hypothetical protein
MQGSFGDALFHLDATGATFGRADLDVVVAEASEQSTSGTQ